MRRHHHRCDIESDSESGSDSDIDTAMRCISCREEYLPRDAGTCKECYEEAGETEEELKREIEDLKAKVAFLRLDQVVHGSCSSSFTDVVLIASHDGAASPPIPAHKSILVRSLSFLLLWWLIFTLVCDGLETVVIARLWCYSSTKSKLFDLCLCCWLFILNPTKHLQISTILNCFRM